MLGWLFLGYLVSLKYRATPWQGMMKGEQHFGSQPLFLKESPRENNENEKTCLGVGSESKGGIRDCDNGICGCG